jgi:hypothetical protein
MGVSRENIIHPCSKFISWQNKFLKGISMVLDVHKMSSTLQIKWHTLVLQLLIMERKELGNFNVYFTILLDLHDKHKIQRWGEKKMHKHRHLNSHRWAVEWSNHTKKTMLTFRSCKETCKHKYTDKRKSTFTFTIFGSMIFGVEPWSGWVPTFY